MSDRDYRFHTINILTEFDSTYKRLSSISSRYFTSGNVNIQIRPTITFLTQEITRWRRFLDYILSKKYYGNFSRLGNKVRNILRLGAFEIIFREAIPVYAAVNSAVQLTKISGKKNSMGIVNAVLRQIDSSMKPNLSPLNNQLPLKEIAVQLSHPDWMIKRWISQFGLQSTIDLCRWNNQIPNYTIRRNCLKIKQDKFESWLQNQGITWERSHLNSHFYIISKASKLRISAGFFKGYFTFQDISAGIVTKLVSEHFNQKVMDVCCAPGGKITYMAELMGNKGTMLAYDIDESRLEKTNENINRLNLSCIQIGKKDATGDDFPTSDLILLDVPCTGTGVMAKRADLRWRRNMKNIVEMRIIQKKILKHIASFLSRNGKLVYSTCSLEYEENWGVINNFINGNKDFRVVSLETSKYSNMVDSKGALTTFPPRDSMDGVFAVVLERKG